MQLGFEGGIQVSQQVPHSKGWHTSFSASSTLERTLWREDIVELSLTMRLEKEDSLTLTFDRVDTKHNESLKTREHSKELKPLPK